MIAIWLAVNIVLPVVLLNSALILTILALFFKPRRTLLSSLALVGGCYMLMDIANGWFSINFLRNVVKDPRWITGFVYVNAAAVALSTWQLVRPLLAIAATVTVSNKRKGLLLSSAGVALICTGGLLLPVIYHTVRNPFVPTLTESNTYPAQPQVTPAASASTAELAAARDERSALPAAPVPQTTERYVGKVAQGTVEVFVREAQDSIVLRLRARTENVPSVRVDVNQNHVIDENIDVDYGRVDATPCFQYLLDQQSTTTCGAFRSSASLEVFDEQPGMWRSTIWRIPKAELSSATESAWLVVDAYNLNTKQYLQGSFSTPLRVTFQPVTSTPWRKAKDPTVRSMQLDSSTIQASSVPRGASDTYRGAWFEIWPPTGFTVVPSLRSSTATEGYDSAFFRSPDARVEFYVYSPQWNGEPTDIAIAPNERQAGSETKTSNTKVVTWYTIRAADGSYTRTYQDTRSRDGSTRWVIGVKYSDQAAFDSYNGEYQRFKKSFAQFAD